jgi:hypothetical protein
METFDDEEDLRIAMTNAKSPKQPTNHKTKQKDQMKRCSKRFLEKEREVHNKERREPNPEQEKTERYPKNTEARRRRVCYRRAHK